MLLVNLNPCVFINNAAMHMASFVSPTVLDESSALTGPFVVTNLCGGAEVSSESRDWIALTHVLAICRDTVGNVSST